MKTYRNPQNVITFCQARSLTQHILHFAIHVYMSCQGPHPQPCQHVLPRPTFPTVFISSQGPHPQPCLHILPRPTSPTMSTCPAKVHIPNHVYMSLNCQGLFISLSLKGLNLILNISGTHYVLMNLVK